MPKLSLSYFLRFVWPGSVLFGYWIFVSGVSSNPFAPLLLCLFLGIFIHVLYKGTVWNLQRLVQQKVIGIPQLDMHRKIVDELGLSSEMKRIGVASACVQYILEQPGNADFSSKLAVKNSLCHVAGMSFWLFLGFAAHQFFLLGTFDKPSIILLAVAVLSYLGYMRLSQQADRLEFIFLQARNPEYQACLHNFLKTGRPA